MELLYAYTYFIVYAFLGWVCEDIYCGIGKRKFINRGFLYGPYCPIYGFGALLVIYPLLMVSKHPIVVFIFGMVLAFSNILQALLWKSYSQLDGGIIVHIHLTSMVEFVFKTHCCLD